MDAIDRRLLAALRANGRASFAELARLVGLSSSAVHDRVSRLESGGIITGYHATVLPTAVGAGVTALIGIQPGENGRDEVILGELRAMPQVHTCYTVAGDEAFVLVVRVDTVDELSATIARLRAVDGVARTRTTVVLTTHFEERVPAEGESTD